MMAKQLPRSITSTDLEFAYHKACQAVRSKARPLASMQDAGMVTVPGIGECQVFVKVCRFDAKLLKDEPLTGGLLCEATGRALSVAKKRIARKPS
jgi:hypothetical protein